MEINFINNNEGHIKLQLSPEMTVNEMVKKYCSKIGEDPNKFGTSIFLTYNQQKINTDSEQQIRFLFRGIDTLYVVYNEESSLVEENEQKKKKIRKRQKQSMNSKKGNKQRIKDTLEDMALLGCIENQKIQHQLKKIPEQFISAEECLKSGDDQFFILGIMAKYLANLGISPIIERADVTEVEEEQIDANTLLQFICNGYILKKKFILDFSLKKERIQQLEKNEDQRDKINEAIKTEILKAYNINQEDLIVTDFKKNRNAYTVILVFKNNFNKTLSKEELYNIFKKNKYDLKYFSNVQELPILEAIRLNRSMLDSRGNNKDDSNWGYDETRGGQPYYPPEGWHRYGLRVYDKYDNQDNDWLSYDNREGEWCIAYGVLSSINKKYQQSFENDYDINHPGNKIGNGVYTWFKPEFMNDYTEIINVNGTLYKMGLMLRVRPEKIRIPQNEKNVWVVNGIPDEIRPYGILLKKIK